MARNKFDVDEELESPFDIRHFKRALKYVGKYKRQVIISMVLSIFAAVIGLLAPLITQRALDVTIPQGNKTELIILSAFLLLTIIISVEFSAVRARIMTKAGQDMIYDIRKDLFEHLQKLSFEYYDTRPHGKILTRVINYVNSVSDLLTNGLITFVLELFNILFIIAFMFIVCWQLALVVLAGMPVFI
ncbi:MAG: ABC transporter transmembrane domain-containing protein, partial [Huintestinicola sp.]